MSEIIFPILLVVGLGLAFGIILTIAAKLMFVPVDEIVAKIREELPGANCGACGFAGCDDYAAAFEDDKETPINKCPVGGPELAEKLGAILGVEASTGASPVAVVMCQGNNSLAANTAVARFDINLNLIYQCASPAFPFGINYFVI